MKPDFKAAMFDMDGTLLCTMRYWRFATLELLLAHDIIPTNEQLARMYTTSSRRLCAEILAQRGIEMTSEAIVTELEGYMHRHYLHDAHVKPQVAEYLAQLHARGVPMCVGTGAPRGYARDGLERLKLAQYFEFITDCYEYNLNKGSPAYFDLMAEKLGVETRELCVFEDALYAIRSAKEAGCPVIAILDPTQINDREGIIALADHAVHSYSELLSQL